MTRCSRGRTPVILVILRTVACTLSVCIAGTYRTHTPILLWTKETYVNQHPIRSRQAADRLRVACAVVVASIGFLFMSASRTFSQTKEGAMM